MLLVDKPPGPTSHDVVAAVRRAFGERRVGHAGTLDPFASGLLLVLVGRATRLARYLEPLDKTYLATARLGVTTDTEDRTGTVTGGAPREVTRQELREAMGALTGQQLQRPPAFSAKHVDGRRSYQLARRGMAMELPAAPVQVHELQLVEHDGETVVFRTRVGSGTYVRALARDLGTKLGTGAHLLELRRERIGGFNVMEAVPLGLLSRDTGLLPPEAAVTHLPSIMLEAHEARAVLHGRAVRRSHVPDGAVALLHDDRLAAVGRADAGAIRPEVVLQELA
jgi:tRNA pseudouridine55 synthase